MLLGLIDGRTGLIIWILNQLFDVVFRLCNVVLLLKNLSIGISQSYTSLRSDTCNNIGPSHFFENFPPFLWNQTLCSTPLSLCSSVFTSFTNSLVINFAALYSHHSRIPWSLIWISKHPCLQTTSYKNWATVVLDLFFIGLASDFFEKNSTINTTRQ